MALYHSEREKKRFTARLELIYGTDLQQKLSRYRKDINKRAAILKRGVRADVIRPTSPKRMHRGVKLRAHDEIELCHKFLDDAGISRMDIEYN